MKCMKKCKKTDHTRRRNHPGGRRLSEKEVLSEKREFGKVRGQKGLGEIEKNEMEIALTLYI